MRYFDIIQSLKKENYSLQSKIIDMNMKHIDLIKTYKNFVDKVLLDHIELKNLQDKK